MKYKYLFWGVLFLSFQVSAGVSIKDPWIRETVPGQSVAAGYMTISSNTETELIGGTTAIAENIEVHEMRMQGDIMKMRKLDKLVIKPGQPIVLSPSGYHLMLGNIRQPLRDGDTIPITLFFNNLDGTVDKATLAIPVKAAAHHDKSNHTH